MIRHRSDTQASFLRHLVRYVDEDQAVIEVLVRLPRRPALRRQASAPAPAPAPAPGRRTAEVLVEIAGPDGFNDEQRLIIASQADTAMTRVQVVYPRRWWPAGMGEQALYTLTMSLVVNGELIAKRASTLGLTSVRHVGDNHRHATSDSPHELLVNGQICPIHSILPVDLIDEHRLLPVAGHSLLIVRGHYGPDVLYESADRTGLLLVQAVPIDPEGQPEIDVAAEVDRLANHPSLAGWFVGHLGAMRDRMAQRIRELDPSRNVLLDIPGATAA